MSNYKYHNENPNGYHIPDCVIRAITTATGLSYYDVICKLKINGDLFHCDELNVRCYEKLLDYDFDLPHYVGNDKTASKVAEDFKDYIVILRMDGHLSVSVYGVIHDIWDCSDEIITDFWIVD
jgi:hypothetical protein